MDSAAEILMTLPKDFHYVFDIVHFILCIQGDREDMGEGFEATSRNHPLACWVSAMLSCFSHGVLVAPLCGEPVMAAFGDGVKVAIATVLWFLVSYTPHDLFYHVAHMFPVRVILYILKGLYFPKKVLAGLKHAKHLLPGNYVAMILVACCKANGPGLIKPLCRLARGVWRPLSSETMVPSLCTKYCVVAALLFMLLPGDLTYVCVTGLFLAMKVGPLLGVPVDFFSPLEQRICPLVLGVPEDAKKKEK